jgi:hypothetical protein
MKLIYVQDGDEKLYLKDGAEPEHQVWTLDRSQAQRVAADDVAAVAAWVHHPLAIHAEDADAHAAHLAGAVPPPVRPAGVRPAPASDPMRHVRLTDDHPLDAHGRRPSARSR